MWRTADKALVRNIALVCLADGIVGISYGAIAVSSGLDLWVPILLSVVVLAGASEFLFVGIIASGGSLAAATVAGLVVNARHLPFGLAVGDVVGSGKTRLAGSHLMNDESVVFALGEREEHRKRAAFWICGIGILVCWPLGAAIGAMGGGLLGGGDIAADTAAFGLDAMFPAVLLALVMPALREASTRRPALVGAGIALMLTPFLPVGLPVLLALAGLLILIPRKALR